MSRSFTIIDEPIELQVGPAGALAEDAAVIRVVGRDRAIDVLLATELLAVLAERTRAIIDELEARGLTAIVPGRPGARARALPDGGYAILPAQTVLVGWDDEIDRIVLEAWSPADDGGAGEGVADLEGDAVDDVLDDDPLGPDVVRVRLTSTMAVRFCQQADAVVASESHEG